jgi:hypothetical protein
MSRKTKPKPQRINLRPFLEPFIPLLVNQNVDTRIEAETNKNWHLGTKEYDYVQTLAGHQPLNK